MPKKKIDLSKFAEDISDGDLLRKIFYNDYDLQRLFLLINNHNPISINNLTKEWNKIFQRNNDKRFVLNKMEKIDRFGLIKSRLVSECQDGDEILQTHKAYLEQIPISLHSVYKNMRYYYLTEKGLEWVDNVSEQLLKKKGL